MLQNKLLTHQPHSALGPLPKVARHLRQIGMIILCIQQWQYEFRNRMSLQPRVHRSHQYPVGQAANVRSQIERFEHVRIVRIACLVIIRRG